MNRLINASPPLVHVCDNMSEMRFTAEELRRQLFHNQLNMGDNERIYCSHEKLQIFLCENEIQSLREMFESGLCFWHSCHVEDLYQSTFEEASKVDAAGKLEMWDYLKLNIHIRNIVAAAVIGQMKNKKLIIFLEEELVQDFITFKT